MNGALFMDNTSIIDTNKNMANIGSIGCGAITSSGTISGNELRIAPITASSNIKMTDTGQEDNYGTTSTKKKQFTVYALLAGSYTITYDISVFGDPSGGTGTGEIKINGTTVNTQTTTSASFTTKTVTLTQTIHPGDTIELWIKNSGSLNYTYCRNFHVKFDYGTTPTALYAVTV